MRIKNTLCVALLCMFYFFLIVLRWKAVDSDLTEIYNADRVKMVVHGTTMSAWESISESILRILRLFWRHNLLAHREARLVKDG